MYICVLHIYMITILSTSYLYQIAHLGDDDDEPEFTSSMPLDEGDTFFFAPRPLKNLVVIDELNNLCPVIDCRITDLGNEDTPQLYALCGSGPRSSLRVLKHGLEVRCGGGWCDVVLLCHYLSISIVMIHQ